MPHPLTLALEWAGAFTGLVAFLVAAHRVARWVRAQVEQLLILLRRIEVASHGVQQLSQDVHELAGSIIKLVVALVERQQEHDEALQAITSRLNDLAELYTDLTAAIARLRRRLDPREDR